MTLEEFLFSFTFVFGVIYLLSHTPLFTKSLETFTEAFTIKTPKWLKLVGYWGFYLSLFYQALFWARFLKIITPI
jgi:hypothetical protein